MPAPANDDDCLCNGALKAPFGDSGLDLDCPPSPLDNLLGLALGIPGSPLPEGSSMPRSVFGDNRASGPHALRSPILRC